MVPYYNSTSTVVEFSSCASFHELQKTKPAPQQDEIQQPRRCRRLRFAPYDEVVEIPHIRDLSQKEIDDVWMRRDELQAIRRCCLRMVLLMDNADNDNDDMNKGEEVDHGLCLRGLDQNTSTYTQTSHAIMGVIYKAVFGIQSFQRSKGVAQAPELIAELCQKYSSSSVAAAYVVGMSDAVEAAHHHC